MKDLIKIKIFGNIHATEPLGAFDGPGLRYVLFLQGCPFRCQFCHNRDSWSTDIRKQMTVEEVLTDYKKFQAFYTHGGITVSGGEPIMQLPFLTALFKEAKKRGIHTTLDTSAACFSIKQETQYSELMKYTDLVLLDIKQIDNEKHKILVGAPNTHVLEFARFLSNINKDTIIRHVTVPTINDDLKSLKELRIFLDSLTNVIGIDILPYHTAGTRKWQEMGLKYPLEGIKEPTKAELEIVTKILKDNYKYKLN